MLLHYAVVENRSTAELRDPLLMCPTPRQRVPCVFRPAMLRSMEHLWKRIEPTFEEILQIIDFKFARDQERQPDKECAACECPYCGYIRRFDFEEGQWERPTKGCPVSWRHSPDTASVDPLAVS